MAEKIICDCGHPVEIHNQFNCVFAFEKENECRCPLGRETVLARYWARRMKKEADQAIKAATVATDKLNLYLAWRNANDLYA